MNHFALGLLFVAVLAACGGDAQRIVLDASDSGSEVLVDTGDQFHIKLESNPSTGHSWILDLGPTADILVLRSSVFSPPETDQVGAAGTETFVFEATKPGAGIVRLDYIRPFEEQAVPERVVEIIVRVDGVPLTRDTAEPPTRSTATADKPMSVAELLGSDGAGNARVTGFVVWGSTSTRLCEALMESFPPQCGGLSVVIVNPEELDADALQSAQGVQRTDGFAELRGSFDGSGLTLG